MMSSLRKKLCTAKPAIPIFFRGRLLSNLSASWFFYISHYSCILSSFSLNTGFLQFRFTPCVRFKGTVGSFILCGPLSNRAKLDWLDNTQIKRAVRGQSEHEHPYMRSTVVSDLEPQQWKLQSYHFSYHSQFYVVVDNCHFLRRVD